jgi:hypothetical protein
MKMKRTKELKDDRKMNKRKEDRRKHVGEGRKEGRNKERASATGKDALAYRLLRSVQNLLTHFIPCY